MVLRPFTRDYRDQYARMVHCVMNPCTQGTRNVETHLVQVRGQFQPFNGVSLPSFLPETS